MVKKTYLLGLGNDGFRHWYEFKKNEKFKEIFKRLLLELKFDKDYVNTVFVSQDQQGDEISEKISDITVEQVRLHLIKNFDIEVFYGSKSIIVMIRTKERKKLIHAIEKLFKFFPELEK